MKLYISSLFLLYGVNAIGSPKSECKKFIKYKAGQPQKQSRGNSDYDYSDYDNSGDGKDESSPKKSYLIFLDETGSMQKLGNAESNEKKGRQIIIEEMNKFIKELKQDGASSESPITIVHFNKQADWRRYEKISDVPVYTKKIYNPGYPTNLYDTLGCVLSTYAESYPNEILKVFVISDGVHQMNSRERRKYGEPVHSKNDVNGIITELKDNNQWEFEFYAVSSPSKKQEMKNHAKNLGFVSREIRAFRFEGKQMGALLKTIRKSIGLKDESAIPVCKKCPKGPKGKKCRKRRKSQIDLGQCSKE